MSVTAAATSTHVGRPYVMTLDAFRQWQYRWTIELVAAYGDSVRVNDYLEHFGGCARTLRRYRRALEAQDRTA